MQGLHSVKHAYYSMRLHNCSAAALRSCVIAATLCGNVAYAASSSTYTNNAVTAIKTLNSEWYSTTTGLWDGAWWQSANALTTLADFAAADASQAQQLKLASTIANTFQKAQKAGASRRKRSHERLTRRGYEGFINQFYDDEGWWAMGLIRAYDAFGDEEYLERAVDIFNDMQTGAGTPCNGGIFWNKDRKYVNAVANELYLAVAASLANRIPSNHTYARIALNQWNWFYKSGMINSQNLINDGLDANCKNNGLQTWTVNQGVILGALVELSRVSFNPSYLTTARTLATAAMKALSNKDGILVEVDHCETQPSHCGFDAKQFKGVLVRNLGYLNRQLQDSSIRKFILDNADSIWAKDRDSKNRLGVAWAGPFTASNGATHGSALDALVAAISAA